MPLPLAALGIMGAGAAAGGLSSLFRKKPRTQNISRLTPEQQTLQSQIGQMGIQGLQNPYEGFQPIENQAREQFSQSTIPSLAERFTSMGAGGQKSSAFQGALGQAASGLESSLAALRSQYGMQNRGLSSNLLGQALSPSFDTVYQQHQPGFLESALGGLSGTLGQYGAMKGLGMFGQGGLSAPLPGGQGNLGGQANNAILSQILQLLQRQGAM